MAAKIVCYLHGRALGAAAGGRRASLVGKFRLPEAVGGVKGAGGRPTTFRRGVSAAENPSKTVRKIDLNEEK